MKVSELLQELQDMDPDADVRIAQQPRWPFEYSIATVAETDPSNYLEVIWYDEEDGDAGAGWYIVNVDEDAQDNEHWVSEAFDTEQKARSNLERMLEEHEKVVYLAEGTQLGYLPSEARKAISW